MYKVPDPEELSDFDIREFVVPPLEKYIDRRGYIYILYDRMFPTFIKVSRTNDVYKRLLQYNSDKPFPTAKMLYVSKMFENANEAEKKILDYMYSKTTPSTLTREWFHIKYLDILKEIIERVENILPTYEKS